MDPSRHDHAWLRQKRRHQKIQKTTWHRKNAKWLQTLGDKMKVSELIALLQECNPELQVYSFNDHDIHAIDDVDEIDEWVHLNLGETQ